MGLRILHIITSLERGGKERQLSTIYKYTDREQYPTKIIYFKRSQNSYAEEYEMGDDAIHIERESFLKTYRKIAACTESFRPDIIYSWGITESLFGLALNLIRGITFINGSIRHGIRLRKPSHYYRMFLLQLSPNVVANSRAGLKANKISKGYVLYNGIDEVFSGEITGKAREIKKDLFGEDSNAPVLISVANLVPYKDYFTVLGALEKVVNWGYDFRYVVIGKGPLEQRIREEIVNKGLSDRVRLVGKVANVSDYLAMSDIFIHSSRGEGCSNAILEAMERGLPVIATRVGGTPEIVTDENAYLFGYGNVQDLAGKIKKLLSESELREEMGKSSLRIARERFSPHQMISDYYRILELVTR